MMKKIARILLVAATLGIATTSCNFLDEPLKNDYSSQTIFNSDKEADLALTGVYNTINFTTSNNMIWVFGDVASDDAVKGGSASDQADIGLIDKFEVKADNGILLTYWQFLYESINQSNNLICADFGKNVSPDLKTQMIAQAKFIRAYDYFNLVNVWGKVPLRLEPLTPNNANLGLSDVATIYNSIQKDLRDAAAVLPVGYDSKNTGRITKGAALGLLAKSQLYQQQWNACLQTIQQIDGLNLYGLEKNYADLFKQGAENSKEVLFAICHKSHQNPSVGNSLNQWFAPLVENGYYFNAPTTDYTLCFNENTTDGKTDPRLDASIGRPGMPWLNKNTFDASWSSTGFLVKKHNQPLSQVDKGIKNDGSLPYIYLRYADIILMKAECLMQENKLDDAVAQLNRVRERAHLAPAKNISKEQVRSAIYLERRREFGFEFHRFFDLMRWGKDIATKALGPNFKWQEPRYYFPIPQAERDTNKGIK